MGAAAESPESSGLSTFSLLHGDLLDRALAVCRLSGESARRLARRSVALPLIAWTPLLVATLAEGTAFGMPGAFLRDVAIHVRLMLALPLLLAGERAIDRRLRDALAHLDEAEMFGPERAHRALEWARRVRDSRVLGVALVGVVVALSVSDALTPRPGPHWMFWADGRPARLSLAGWIEVSLSAPLYRLVVLRWLWRLLVWFTLMISLARAHPRISALHSDEVGGLGVLAEAHTSFGWFLTALGATLAGNLTSQRLLTGVSVMAFNHSIGAFCVLAPLVCLAPMFAFAWPLERARREAHRRYGITALEFARRYASTYLDPARRVPVDLGSPDPSTAEDLGASFTRMIATRRFPFTRDQCAFVFGCAAAPMVPFYLQELPIDEILSNLARLVA